MRLTKITLDNFRNYSHTEFEFGERLTVLVGKNGMGKTNLLLAITQALSFAFARKKDTIQEEFLASSDQKIKSFKGTDARYDDAIQDYQYPINIGVDAILAPNQRGIHWNFEQDSSSSGLKYSLYENANQEFWRRSLEIGADIPLFAFYSDAFPHIRFSGKTKIQEKMDLGKPLPRNTAFYKWDDERNCAEVWEQYFIMLKKKADRNDDFESRAYVEAVEEVFRVFTRTEPDAPNADMAVRGFSLRARLGGADSLVVDFANGRSQLFEELPQGYMRLFSIVFDLACRAYLLNKNCNPSGVAIVDEIELHLHLAMQQDVLERLLNTFPSMQFVVSTHAPMVLSNLKQEASHKLYVLQRSEAGYEHELLGSDVYGEDISAIAQVIMGVSERTIGVQRLIDYVQEAINTKDAAMARQRLTELQSKVDVNNMAVIRLGGFIKRLEILGK